MTDNPNIIEINEQNFVSAVAENSNRVPVFLDFYADWCAPCQTLMPVLTKLAEEYQGKFIFAKVNSDEQKELAAQFGVKSLPTVKIVRNGKTIDEFQGAKSEHDLRELIEKVIDHEWNLLHQQAVALIHQGELDDAIALLREATQLQPLDLQIKIDLASILFQTGNTNEANSVIETFSETDKQNSSVIALLSRISYQQIVDTAPDLPELENILNKNPNDLEAREQLIATLIISAQYEQAMQQLLQLMKLEMNTKHCRAKKGMLDVFSLLGNSGELVKRYRSKMSSLLN
ncbi:MAG: tetratricopeptide repeat protein [Gammaproteobacteria bacterium]